MESREQSAGTAHQTSEVVPEGVPKEEAFLLAWDPENQKEVWRVNMTTIDFNGGVLSTGSNLVFEGTVDGFLVVYDALTGKELKRIETGTGIIAAPVAYEIDGEQYVAVMAGYGGAPLRGCAGVGRERSA